MALWAAARGLPAAAAAVKFATQRDGPTVCRADDARASIPKAPASGEFLALPDAASRVAELRRVLASREGWKLGLDRGGISCFHQSTWKDAIADLATAEAGMAEQWAGAEIKEEHGEDAEQALEWPYTPPQQELETLEEAQEEARPAQEAAHKQVEQAPVSGECRTLPDAASRVAELRRVLGSREGWKLGLDRGGISCFHQRTRNGIVRLRAEASIDAPLFDLLCLIYEVGHWHRWVPSAGGLGLQKAQLLGQQGPLRLVYDVETKLPWPLASRTCRFAAEAVDNMASAEEPHIAILLDTRRAMEVCPDLPVLGLSPKTIGAEVMDSGILLTPPGDDGAGGTKVQWVLTLDPKFSVPEWLLASTVGLLSRQIFGRAAQASTFTRTPELLEKSCDPEHPFYSYVRQRMAQALPSQLALAPPVRG